MSVVVEPLAGRMGIQRWAWNTEVKAESGLIFKGSTKRGKLLWGNRKEIWVPDYQRSLLCHLGRRVTFLEPFHRDLEMYIFVWLVVPSLSQSTWAPNCGMRTLSCIIWDLVPWPGIKPAPPELQAWSLSHRTTREVPYVVLTVELSPLEYTFVPKEK